MRIPSPLLISGLLLLGWVTLAAPALAGSPVAAGGFDLQGHRGARGLLPENTLPAFARALSIGVSTLEMDLGLSRDGVVVVTHNPRLEPSITRDAKGQWLSAPGAAIHALTLSELQTFNVGGINPGSRYARRFPGQASLALARIPTLAEVLDLIRRSGNTKVRVNIETKIRPVGEDVLPTPGAFTAAVLKVLREEGFLERATLQSFDWRTLREAQRLAPSLPTSYLTAQQDWLDNIQQGVEGPSPWMAGLDIDDFGGDVPKAIKAAGGHVWSPFHREVTPESVRRAHELGLKVKVWTVNDPERMEALIGMGVDGIITDYPGRLRKVMEARGLPLPAPTPVNP